MRILLATLLFAATLFAWGRSSDTTQAVGDGFTLGATGAHVECDHDQRPTECAVYGTDTFQLTVNATNTPSGGYEAFTASIDFTSSCFQVPAPCVYWLTYVPRADCTDEVVWPDEGACHESVDFPQAMGVWASTGEGYPMPTSTFVGRSVEFDVQCPGPEVGEPRSGVRTLRLYSGYFNAFPFQGDDTAFVTTGKAGTGSLNIDCRSPLDEPPTPTSTPTPIGPQPTPANSVAILDFDTYPGDEWEIGSSGGTSYVSGGILTINSPAMTYHEFMLNHPDGLWHQEVSNSRGWAVEARLRVAPSSQERCGADLIIWANDHTNLVQIGFGTDEVCLIYPDIVRYSMATSDGFHVYRIESQFDNVKVYVDGELVIDHILSRTGGGSDVLLFGDGDTTTDNKSLSYWDYFMYDVNPDDSQPARTPTPVDTPSGSAAILDFDNFPGGDWQFDSTGGTAYVSGGVLTIDSPLIPYKWGFNSAIQEFKLWHPDGLWHEKVSNSRGWMVEARLKVAPSSSEWCGNDILIWMYDHDRLVKVGFGTDGVCLIFPDEVYYPMDTTDGFHVYRVEVRLDNAKVYVDGDLVIDHVLSQSGVGSSDVLMFGDGQSGHFTSLSYWDYFMYDVDLDDHPVTPEHSTVPGDINCDHRVNAVDAVLVLQSTAGLLGSLLCEWNEDVNEDSETNSIDAALILQYVAGLVPQLPV